MKNLRSLLIPMSQLGSFWQVGVVSLIASKHLVRAMTPLRIIGVAPTLAIWTSSKVQCCGCHSTMIPVYELSCSSATCRCGYQKMSTTMSGLWMFVAPWVLQVRAMNPLMRCCLLTTTGMLALFVGRGQIYDHWSMTTKAMNVGVTYGFIYLHLWNNYIYV